MKGFLALTSSTEVVAAFTVPPIIVGNNNINIYELM